jgi:hypothetical protein
MTYQPKAPAIIDANMAVIEEIFAKTGADGLASLIATRLRNPCPDRAVLDAVARLLEPHDDDDLALVVVRRSAGNTKTRSTQRLDDIKLAMAVLHCEQEDSGAKRGIRKRAVDTVANREGISKAKVLKALKVLPLIPK